MAQKAPMGGMLLVLLLAPPTKDLSQVVVKGAVSFKELFENVLPQYALDLILPIFLLVVFVRSVNCFSMKLLRLRENLTSVLHTRNQGN